MAQSIVLKRSALGGKVPDTGSLSLGEVAINTYDGRVFFKKSGSIESVEHIVTTNSITTGSITLTKTGSFGEIVVTQDGNFQRDIFVTRDIVANGDIDVLGSLTASLSNGYVWVGNGSNRTTLVPTSSFGGTVLADVNLLISKTGSYATTGSNVFIGNQTITGSLTITQDLIVLGSSSIQNISSSTLNVGTNIITVAVNQPSVRFGGISVIDSGSSNQSGSFLYDSVEDEFIFVHKGDGSNITSSHFILGPETYNSLGNETYLTLNRLPKGTGIEHLVDSNITDTGTFVSINSNTQITGSLVISGSNSITASIIGNPFGDIIIAAKSGSINTGSIELHGGLKWKRTSNAVATEIGDLITFGGTMGLIEGGGLTTSSVGGLVAQAGEAVMYTMNTFPYGTHNLVKFDTIGTSDASRQITLPQTSSVYVYYNNSGVLTYAATAPSSRSNIILGKVTTDNTKIIYIDASQINAHHYSNYIDRLFREGLGPIFSSGGIVTQGTISGSLNVTAATYFFSQNRITTNAGTNVSMDTFYRSSTAGQYVRTTGVTTVSSSSYDSGSGVLVNIPSGKYTKHSLYILGDNSLQATATEAYMLVYGQSIYDTLGDAQAGSLPSPPSYFTDSISIIASIVVTPDSSSIQAIIDERPRLGFISPSKTGILTTHADLSGLTSDDHPQYILVDGTRTLTGNLNLGNNNITNINSLTATTINGSINATNGVVSGSSQITISSTTGYSTFSSSLDNRLDSLESFTASLDANYVNQSELSTATGSLINSIATKLNTSSFNSYTSSNDSRVSSLESFTASLDVTYVNQTELATATGSLINSITTKLNTSSFETYTGSIDTKFTTLTNVTASLINATSSYETKGRGIVSGSSQITPLLPVGTVSGSSQVVGILTSLNSYTASNDTTNTTQNSRLSSLESFTSSLDATYVNQTELATATGSLINSIATKLNTSSFEVYTGSIDTKFTTLSNLTASLNVSTASQQNSIDLLGLFSSSENTKNSTLASYTSSIDTKFTTLATYTSSVDTKFTTLANVTASLNQFTASASSRLSSLESFTASLDTTYVNQTELANATGSLINSIATKLNTSSFEVYTGSIDTKFTTLANVTSSLNASTASQQNSIDLIGQFTSSENTKNSTLATYTGSVDTKFTTLANVTASLNQFTSSANTRFSNLESFTASLDTTYVNQTELANATGSLINSIATKLNTSSFETYTGSVETKFTTLSNITSSLNQSTASQQNSIDLLGAFTSSENTKNSTLATYTGSVDTKFTTLQNVTASLQLTTASLQNSVSVINSFTSSTNSRLSSIESFTASLDATYVNQTELATATGSLINSIATKLDTSSFQTYTGSIDTKFTTLANLTSSLNASTASQQNSIDLLNAFSSSENTKNSTLATYTGSVDTKFTTLQNLTASILSFTSSTNSRLSSIESFTASLDNTFVNNTELANATGSLINSIATKLDTSSFQTYTGSIDTKFTTLGTYTSSVDTKFTTLANLTASLNASTASQQNSIDLLGAFSASENTKNTTLATYTGSVDIKFTTLATTTASLLVETANLELFSASTLTRLSNIELFSASENSKNTTLATYTSSIDSKFTTLQTTTASIQNSITLINTFTSSVDTKFTTLANVTSSIISKTGSYATTGSNTFYGTQTMSGSVYVTGDLVVIGSSSISNISGSSLSIGDNQILLNTFTPAIRFGGISVIDSGSNGTTGSLWWDSVNNHWLYEHPGDSPATYNSAILIAGPTNTGSLGQEVGLNSNRLTVATGTDHISSSQIYVDNSVVSIPSTLQVTGSTYFYKSSTDYVSLLDEANTITFSPNGPSYIKYGNATILAMKSGGGNSTILYGAGAAILSATQFGVKIQQSADGAMANSMLYVKGSGSAATSTAVKVENSSGNPSMTIFDNNTIAINKTSANGTLDISGSVIITGSLDINNVKLNTTASNSSAGNVLVSTNPTASYNSAFYNYSITSGTNARAGQIMSIWNGSTLRYTEVTTTDIGNTSTAVFSASLSGGNILLHLSSSGVWNVRSIVNLL